MSEKLSLKELALAEKEAAARERRQAGDPSVMSVPAGTGEDDGFYSPPVTSIPLPSRGRVYPVTSPLFDTDSLDVRAMVATDENILTSPALIRKGKMLSALMRACVTNRSINPDEMLIGDRNAIMIGIRNCSYGPTYAASVTCPDCERDSEHQFDLSRLTVKTLDVDPAGGPGSNMFEFRLPVTGKTVHFALATATSAFELEQLLEAQKKAKGPGGVEENVTQGLIHQIVSIDGNSDRKFIARFVERMPVMDSRALRGYIDKISPGVDMTQGIECPHCGTRSDVEVPITAEFFWPKTGS